MANGIEDLKEKNKGRAKPKDATPVGESPLVKKTLLCFLRRHPDGVPSKKAVVTMTTMETASNSDISFS